MKNSILILFNDVERSDDWSYPAVKLNSTGFYNLIGVFSIYFRGGFASRHPSVEGCQFVLLHGLFGATRADDVRLADSTFSLLSPCNGFSLS